MRASPGLSAGAGARQFPSTCPFNASDTQASRDVELAAPSFSLAKGDSLVVTYEFAIASVSHRTANLLVTVPSFTAMFPLSNGSTLLSFLPPRAIYLNGTAWSSGSLATKAKTMGGPVAFTSSPARMTSELWAIMANASYQTVDLVFRWDWSVTFAGNGTTTTSAWSRVVLTGSHPSTFYPAPYVRLVSTTNTTLAIGNVFTAYLTGAVTNTIFLSVLEYASTGRDIRMQQTFTGAGTSSPDAVSIWIMPHRTALGPTTLLDHVRDYCLGLLYSISVHVVYSSSANVTLRSWPAGCGPVKFNGTWYSSGSVVRIRPSSSAVAISDSLCAGRTFQGWTRSDGVWVGSPRSSNATATISASGNLTASFR